MNQQIVNTGQAPAVQRFTHSLVEALSAATTGRSSHRGRSISRRSQRSSEIAWGVGLFVVAFVLLVWLHVQFGVAIAPLDY